MVKGERTSSTRTIGFGSGPRLGLKDLLRRRRSTLERWATELGIETYGEAVKFCSNIGVNPPTNDEWEAVFGPVTPATMHTVQTEGIVVVEHVPLVEVSEPPPKKPFKRGRRSTSSGSNVGDEAPALDAVPSDVVDDDS